MVAFLDKLLKCGRAPVLGHSRADTRLSFTYTLSGRLPFRISGTGKVPGAQAGNEVWVAGKMVYMHLAESKPCYNKPSMGHKIQTTKPKLREATRKLETGPKTNGCLC